MKIGQRFSQLTKQEYFYYISHHKKYTDFNTLGMYRSIIENTRLNVEDKKEVREYAHQFFGKTFAFYPIKDPITYFELAAIGQELTKADEHQIWEDIKHLQQKILKEKRIKHRNFGIYSKHDCGMENCQFKGLMLKQGSWLAEHQMYFETDNRNWNLKEKAQRLKQERKNVHRILKVEQGL